ncbi:trafficking protein particle complex subunit 6A isoform X1 [Kogia breviceps]|uniref:trafficking protein particle complex subunit 6A isoform X1 n=1 Tax=Kogia breviceps TaxID=27615 RepID=UPI0034D1B6E3
MRTRGAGRLLGRGGRRMADAALFEFLHTEMVAELWAQDPDPGPGGQKTSLSVLEGMGFRVGQALGERLPRETLAFREELDVLKFLCKDVWAAVFHKQMDSLRTNHQGTYVLQDNSFPLLIRMASGLQYLEEAPKFLAFTCGLLRGTLSTLGLKSLVTASVAALPASSGGVTCLDSARLCHLLPDVGKYPHLRAVHRGCGRPKWEEEGSPQWVGLLCRQPMQPLPGTHS